jgi:sulfopropanediol 3-dehydrogenase
MAGTLPISNSPGDHTNRAIAQVSDQGIRDTDYCQGNVRRFAQEQLKTLPPLGVEIPPGVWLGHRQIPVNAIGSYIPGGRYPMFGSAPSL